MIINVMLVDDEAPTREYLRGLIDWEANGFCIVAEAQSVDKALKHLETKSIDLVLMDVFMPGRTGVDLSREIAARYSNVMMIAISSYDNYDYVREILVNGAHDYVLKHSLNADSLLQLLQAVRHKMKPAASEHDSKQTLHHSIKKWLFEGGKNPFVQERGRLVISIGRLSTKDTRLETPITAQGEPLILQKTLYAGVEQIIKSSTTVGEQEAIAVFIPPRHCIVCTIFRDAVSEAKIHNAVNINNLRAVNSIRLLYKTEAHFVICPITCPSSQLPEYVSEIVANDFVKPLAVSGLTIAAKKQLLVVIEQRNSQRLREVFWEAFTAVSEGNVSLILLIDELAELHATASHEYAIEAEPLTADQKKMLDTPSQQTTSKLCEFFCDRFAKLISAADAVTPLFSPNVKSANSFIEKYYGSSISLHHIAKSIGVSASYLSRLYRQETGTTVIDYLTRVRVEAAKEHLVKGIPLKEAAYLCGFSSYNYFFKVFKDYEGVTPKEYMQRIGKR